MNYCEYCFDETQNRKLNRDGRLLCATCRQWDQETADWTDDDWREFYQKAAAQ